MIATLFAPAAAAPAWNRYRLAMNALDAESESAGADEGRDRRAADAEQALIANLEQVLAWQPTCARAHLELAEAYLRRFALLQASGENPMSLTNIRDAVLQSRFPSRSAMLEWLGRAVGQHADYLEQALQHTRRAVELCPLLGRGYVYLAELCFL